MCALRAAARSALGLRLREPFLDVGSPLSGVVYVLIHYTLSGKIHGQGSQHLGVQLTVRSLVLELGSPTREFCTPIPVPMPYDPIPLSLRLSLGFFTICRGTSEVTNKQSTITCVYFQKAQVVIGRFEQSTRVVALSHLLPVPDLSILKPV